MLNETTAVCAPCDHVALERTRFFPRQLVTPDDLTQDQDYFREKLRRHNRMLHGWGIVCGARVRAGACACEVIVAPGYILGPYGDEIMIDHEVTVDLCHEDLNGAAQSPCAAPSDPWCSDVRVHRPTNQPLYLAVRYAECRSRPVRVVPGACGCNEVECEYSRIRDSYTLKVLADLPVTYADKRIAGQPLDSVPTSHLTNPGERGRTCLPCPPEPWVILATATLDASGHVNLDDKLRRYVVSLADYYQREGE